MSRLSGNVVLTVKVAGTVFFGAVVYAKIEPGQLAEAFSRLAWPVLLLNVLLAACYVLLKAAKWHVTVNAYQHVAFVHSLSSYLAGLVGGIITPGRVGEVSRALFIPRINRVTCVGLVVFDKAVELLAVVLLALGGVYYFGGWTATGIVVILLAAGTLAARSQRLWEKIARLVPDRVRGEAVRQAVLSVANRRLVGKVLVLALFSYLLVMVQFAVFLSMFNEVPFAVVWIVVPLMMLVNVVPFTISGLGLREASVILMLAHFGVSESAALQVSLLLFLYDSVGPSLAGSLLVWKGKPDVQAI